MSNLVSSLCNGNVSSWEICMQVKKQQLEPDMEQQTGSKLEKEYVKTIYCHPAYLIFFFFIFKLYIIVLVLPNIKMNPPQVYIMQNISWEMLGWMKHKLESSLLGEISITSDMQMTPPLWQEAKRN